MPQTKTENASNMDKEQNIKPQSDTAPEIPKKTQTLKQLEHERIRKLI